MSLVTVRCWSFQLTDRRLLAFGEGGLSDGTASGEFGDVGLDCVQAFKFGSDSYVERPDSQGACVELLLAGEGGLEAKEAVADIGVVIGPAPEQLDRYHVGEGVDHLPGDRRARLRGLAGPVLHLWRRQAKVLRAEKADRGRAEDEYLPDGPDEGDDAFPQRPGRLHHPAGQPPGEVVLEEGERLADDMPLVLPVDQRREGDLDRVVHEQAKQDGSERLHYEHDRRHDQKQLAGGAENLLARDRRQHGDEPADQIGHHGLDDGQREADQEQRGEQALGLPNKMPVERQKSAGRLTRG